MNPYMLYLFLASNSVAVMELKNIDAQSMSSAINATRSSIRSSGINNQLVMRGSNLNLLLIQSEIKKVDNEYKSGIFTKIVTTKFIYPEDFISEMRIVFNSVSMSNFGTTLFIQGTTENIRKAEIILGQLDKKISDSQIVWGKNTKTKSESLRQLLNQIINRRQI